MPTKDSVLVIGGGPAGSTAAIFLARSGWRVTLCDPGNRVVVSELPRVGETLPPAARQLLQQIGVSLNEPAHLRSYGIATSWGSTALRFNDYLQQPDGFGWHLDRARFEQQLWQLAAVAGVDILTHSRVVQAERAGQYWRVDMHIHHKKQVNDYAWLIDASGRNGWLGRRLGIERIMLDRQVALVAFLATADAVTESAVATIESVADGWWYSCPLPHKRRAVYLVARPTTAQRRIWRRPAAWQKKVQQTRYIVQQLEKHQLLTEPVWVAADTSRYARVAGEGWLAVGDAGMSYDPLASHGLLMGMVAARDATRALYAYRSGRDTALEEYNQLMCAAFEEYAMERSTYYRQWS